MVEQIETAYAKINLALHVRRRREDGYHEIDTLFAFADDGDRLSAKLADDLSLTVVGQFGDGLSNADNLVVLAAEEMKSHFGIEKGAAINLDKRLPVASGIGGGSADAAAAARLLCRLWCIETSDAVLEQLLAPLGADIPACVQSRTVYGGGTGADLTSVPDSGIRGRAVLLVNPLQPVATGPVFNAWNGIDRGGMVISNPWLATLAGRNDLEEPAKSICPAIGEVLDMLTPTKAELVRMSGSGATCFALYASEGDRDAAQLTLAMGCPEWWTMASCLR